MALKIVMMVRRNYESRGMMMLMSKRRDTPAVKKNTLMATRMS